MSPSVAPSCRIGFFTRYSLLRIMIKRFEGYSRLSQKIHTGKRKVERVFSVYIKYNFTMTKEKNYIENKSNV